MSTFSSFLTKEPRWALFSEFPKLFRFPSLIVKIRFRISRTARPAYLTVSHGEGEALTINSQTLSCRLVFHLVTSAKERKKTSAGNWSETRWGNSCSWEHRYQRKSQSHDVTQSHIYNLITYVWSLDVNNSFNDLVKMSLSYIGIRDGRGPTTKA